MDDTKQVTPASQEIGGQTDAAQTGQTGQDDREDVSLEELFAEMEEILTAMDERDISLEDSFALYEKGMKTVRQCYERLDRVEKKMRVIAQDGSETLFEE